MHSGAEFRSRFPWLWHLLQAQAEAGLHVTWLSLSRRAFSSRQAGVQLRFLPVRARLSYRNVVNTAVTAGHILRVLDALLPDCIHHHDLTSIRALMLLIHWKRRNRKRLIIQHHGGGIPWYKRPAFRLLTRFVDGFLFTDGRAMQEWIQKAGLPPAKTVQMVTVSSVFTVATCETRGKLRRALALQGAPIFGWIANLNSNKDPLTVLRAFDTYASQQPEARLYLHFQEATLLPQCSRFVAERPALQDRVEFRGPLPYREVEPFLQAIDYLVQGSHYEAGGYAVIEGMAAGAVPVVTDIPGFRLLTRNGEFGYLFPPGDSAALGSLFSRLPPQPNPRLWENMIRYFQDHLSYPALTARLNRLYFATG